MANLLKLAAEWAKDCVSTKVSGSSNGAKSARLPLPLSESEIRALLDEWILHVERYKTGDLSYKVAGVEANFIDPYVIQTHQVGHDVNSLIPTLEAKCWWDVIALYVDVLLIEQFNMIRPGDTVFDLGASHGFYSVLFSKLAGPTGRVFAFEPFALNADNIRFNSRLNRANIEVFEIGLSNTTREANVRLDTQCVADTTGGKLVPITLDTLDNYAHLKPDFIKIDIEGAEIDALEAATKLLATRPRLHIEVHTDFFPRFGRKVEDLFDVLPLEDYVVYISHAGHPLERYHRQYEITAHCALYFLKEEPVKRIYPRG